MKKPKNIKVNIEWIDDKGIHRQRYTDKPLGYNIEAAIILLQLMIGELTEEDLKP